MTAKISIVVAAHNEGDSLWKTVRSCVETCGHLEPEIIIADDASTDGSVDEAVARYRQLRVVRHAERLGPSPTKHLGATAATGDVLVFLDGHCKPEPGAIERLIEDVRALDGQAIVTPTIPTLDVETWENAPGAGGGHGYQLWLDTLDCGWIPLHEMRRFRHEPDGERRTFYESPALIGCAFAISRELYQRLGGFDVDMRSWGVEDLDFGVTCWLMGHKIVHDPDPRIGHRFQKKLDRYTVPPEHMLANQLRMARKHFTDETWNQWLNHLRSRIAPPFNEKRQPLWQAAWRTFESHRARLEERRTQLMAERAHDELWYAEHFRLGWPAHGATLSAAAASDTEMNGSPPPPCDGPPMSVQSVVLVNGDLYCAGATVSVEVHLAGECCGETPYQGETTLNFNVRNDLGVHDDVVIATGVCPDECDVSLLAYVPKYTVVGVKDVIVAGGSSATKYICVGEQVTVEGRPTHGADFPQDSPTWQLSKPSGSAASVTTLSNNQAQFTPDVPGTYTITATCGESSASMQIVAVKIKTLSVSDRYDPQNVATNPSETSLVIAQRDGYVNPQIRLTVISEPDTCEARQILAWEITGASASPTQGTFAGFVDQVATLTPTGTPENRQFVVKAGCRKEDGTLDVTNEITVTVAAATMTAFRPQHFDANARYAPFTKAAVPQDKKKDYELGPGIRINAGAASDERNYIELHLAAEPINAPLTLRRNTTALKAYTYDTATSTYSEIPFSQEAGLKTGLLSFDGSGELTVWIEWASSSHSPEPPTLQDPVPRLRIEPQKTSLPAQPADSVVFHTFRSFIAAFTGWGVAPPNSGMSVLAQTLYQIGFDSYQYAEGQNASAVTDITSAVAHRGVTEVAVFGHSYGGNATYEVCDDLTPNGFVYRYTAYVDAILKLTVFPFTDRPPGTQYHVNLYQTNFVNGAAVPLADENVNVNAEAWGANLHHTTIDGSPDVHRIITDGRDIADTVYAEGLTSRVHR